MLLFDVAGDPSRCDNFKLLSILFKKDSTHRRENVLNDGSNVGFSLSAPAAIMGFDGGPQCGIVVRSRMLQLMQRPLRLQEHDGFCSCTSRFHVELAKRGEVFVLAPKSSTEAGMERKIGL